MTFTSVEYVAFLVLVAIVYWVAPPRVRPVFLLVVSYVFYALLDWRFVPLLAGLTLATWWCGSAIARSEGTARRTWLGVAVGLPLAVLLAFEVYAQIDGASAGYGLAVGFGSLAATSVIPIGLAFYTFQIVSYTVDIYRRELEPEPSIVLYATYVAFFPHLLAGPVVRARRLIPQLTQTRSSPEPLRIGEGIELILLGLFKKVAVADPLLRVFSEQGLVGATTSTPTTLLLVLVALIGAFFDIAGYIDIARGSALILGVDMPPNFAQPLTRSRNWTEFWRRWQITVMGWFRDYVFLPIRGRGRTGRREVLALLGTFLAAGLWHGLSVGWLIWSALTAGILVAEQRFRRYRAAARRASGAPRHRLPKPVRAVLGPLYIFGCLMLTAPWAAGSSVSATLDIYSRMFSGGFGGIDYNVGVYAVYAVVVLLVTDQYERHRAKVSGKFDPITWRRSFAYGAMVVALVVFSGSAPQPFVYFQF